MGEDVALSAKLCLRLWGSGLFLRYFCSFWRLVYLVGVFAKRAGGATTL